MKSILLLLFPWCVVIQAEGLRTNGLKEFAQVSTNTMHMYFIATDIPHTSIRKSMKEDLRELYKDYDVQIQVAPQTISYYDVKVKHNAFVIRESRAKSTFDSLLLMPGESVYGVSSNMFWRIIPENKVVVMNYDIMKRFTTLEELYVEHIRDIPLHEPLLGIKLGFPCHPGEYKWDDNKFVLLQGDSEVPLVEGKLFQVNNKSAQLNYFRRLGDPRNRKYHTLVDYRFGSEGELFPLTMETEHFVSGEPDKISRKRYEIILSQRNEQFSDGSFSPMPFIEANADSLRVQIVSNNTTRTFRYANGIWYDYSTSQLVMDDRRDRLAIKFVAVLAVLLPIIAAIGFYVRRRAT